MPAASSVGGFPWPSECWVQRSKAGPCFRELPICKGTTRVQGYNTREAPDFGRLGRGWVFGEGFACFRVGSFGLSGIYESRYKDVA